MLSTIRPFAHLPIEHPIRSVLEMAGAISHFPRGYVIFTEGDPGDRLYVLQEGTVKVGRTSAAGRPHLLGLAGPGDMFGELSIFDSGPRTCTATALTQTRAVSMDHQGLSRWLTDRPEIADHLLRLLARRVRSTNSALAELITDTVYGRVARVLLDLAEQFGRQEDGVLVVAHGLTQREIAQLIGAARKTVNETLLKFERRGWLQRGQRSVLILDPDALANQAR